MRTISASGEVTLSINGIDVSGRGPSEVHVPVRRPHLAPGLVDVDLDAVPGAVVLQVAGVVADGALLAELLHDAAEDGLDVGVAVDALDAAAALLDRALQVLVVLVVVGVAAPGAGVRLVV